MFSKVNSSGRLPVVTSTSVSVLLSLRRKAARLAAGAIASKPFSSGPQATLRSSLPSFAAK